MPAQIPGDYQLLDSGDEMKLEQVGPYRLARPAPQAVWKPRLPRTEWQQVDARYQRNSQGGGEWQWRDPVSRKFSLLYADLSFQIKLTDFGHVGLFPEQAENWYWMRERIRNRMARTQDRNLSVLNLFAYTGGSTLAASQAGAHLVHVDAARGVVDWARDNARDCHMQDRPIRWLVDDVLKFVKREARRGSRYHGIILDPPSFGRGPKGEVFKIEQHLLPLLDLCREVLARDALFVLYSCHTPGFTPITLQNQIADMLAGREGKLEAGEMVVWERDEPGQPRRALPSGTYVRWSAPR